MGFWPYLRHAHTSDDEPSAGTRQTTFFTWFFLQLLEKKTLRFSRRNEESLPFPCKERKLSVKLTVSWILASAAASAAALPEEQKLEPRAQELAPPPVSPSLAAAGLPVAAEVLAEQAAAWDAAPRPTRPRGARHRPARGQHEDPGSTNRHPPAARWQG
jgi:hypothetical protein